jgi:hypothetical protein
VFAAIRGMRQARQVDRTTCLACLSAWSWLPSFYPFRLPGVKARRIALPIGSEGSGLWLWPFLSRRMHSKIVIGLWGTLALLFSVVCLANIAWNGILNHGFVSGTSCFGSGKPLHFARTQLVLVMAGKPSLLKI